MTEEQILKAYPDLDNHHKYCKDTFIHAKQFGYEWTCMCRFLKAYDAYIDYIDMKTLFYFRNNTPTYFEVFANDLAQAQQEIKRLMGDTLTNPPYLTHVIQNHSCPKCSCHATECNYNK